MTTQDAVAILAVVVAVVSLVVSIIVFTVQRWDMRRREMWWAIVEDKGVHKGVPISFRLYRYIGKTKPKRRVHPRATVIRGYVVEGEARIGRERMSFFDGIRDVQKRADQGERNPDPPDEIHPPRITMVPMKVLRYGRANAAKRGAPS
ncbi:MAG: hypothetical protein F4238_12710 [Gemmatimonadetes bacterium]|nr:hypothetical protein [Gammaproteobacteria bacterium]MYE94210.1 hypothetical protein [Gemmatimonadota bacterium]